MVRIRAILIEEVTIRRIGSIGNLSLIIEDEDSDRDIHKGDVIDHLGLDKLGIGSGNKNIFQEEAHL